LEEIGKGGNPPQKRKERRGGRGRREMRGRNEKKRKKQRGKGEEEEGEGEKSAKGFPGDKNSVGCARKTARAFAM